MSLQLLALTGPEAGRAFTLQAGPDLMLGRSPRAFYHLTDPRASRNHCQLLLESDRAIVIDNGGSGGTLVNGAKVTRHTLKLGDVLQVGDTQLRLLMGDFPLDVALAAVAQATPAAKQAPAAPAGLKVEQLAALSGQKLGHYDVGPVIGTGQSCMVFHASDTRDDRSVAFKVLLPEFSKNEEEMQRFVRAMKTVLPLRHPNLVALYGAGKTGPYCWMAMEYMAGERLTETIRRVGTDGKLDWHQAWRFAVHVARALTYAHAKGILHRNVTPQNVLVDAPTRTAKLGDLMLAKALEGSVGQPQLTRPGELLGVINYLAPERTRPDAEVDERADLYGLGATAYALLTGRPPFDGATLVERITRIRQTEPTAPVRFQKGIPPRFEMLVLQLLAKRPEDRPQTADAVLAELERVGKSHGATA